ncbi:MAG: DUF835 domain-containing protein [Thermoplasmata archaeon]|nr:MAG: DUF835 domain-containing protein [Thermoplasmata archaeon]
MTTGKNDKVITDRAPCGLSCARCESFLAEKCSGCYLENSRRKDMCAVVVGEPFEESKKLILCMREKKKDMCNDCEEFEVCEIYDALLLKCPFKRPIYDLKPGYGYLVKEKKPELGFKIFGDMVRHGSNGLCLSRQHPKNLPFKQGKGTLKTYWLTSFEGEGNLQPTNLGILSDIIIRFMEEGSDTVILIDGVELLITQNDFPNVLRMINHIIEVVMQKDTRFIITLDERTLEKKEMALLERNMEIIER